MPAEFEHTPLQDSSSDGRRALVHLEQHLTEISDLADVEWSNTIVKICPEVADSSHLQEDMVILDQIYAESIKYRRKKRKSEIAGLGSLIGIVGGGITLAAGKDAGLPEPVVITGGISLLGAVVLPAFVARGEHRSRRIITQIVDNWNGRGKNLLHKQRDRILGRQ